MDETIKLSVALVTRNRLKHLKRALDSIQCQTIAPFEVIVSDDSEHEVSIGVKELVLDYGFKYFKGPGKGLHANRNFAARQCKGTHYRTMDDDHTFPRDHFEICVNSIKKDPFSIWVVGECYPDSIERNSGELFFPGQLNINGVSSRPLNDQDSWAIGCGSSIYPASVIRRGAYYCELYKFGNLHLEYGARLYRLGYKMRLITDTFVVHDLDIKKRSFNIETKQEIEIRCFLSLCYSQIYFPSLFNKCYLPVLFLKSLFQSDFGTVLLAWIAAIKKFGTHKQFMRCFQ